MYNIENDAYRSLLQYMFTFCDTVTLQVPNHNNIIKFESYYTLDAEHEIDYKKSEDPLYAIYFENANRLIDKIFGKYIKKSYYDNEYLTSRYSDERKIYIIQLNQEVVDNLSFFGSLFAWEFPFLPEDLCFFRNDICWLQSIVHEKICWIYDDKKATLNELKKMKLEFQQIPDELAPLLRSI
jgi:hypothetical protein